MFGDSSSPAGATMPDAKQDMADARAAVSRARRVVVKIGSRALASEPEIYERLARAVRGAHEGKRSEIGRASCRERV